MLLEDLRLAYDRAEFAEALGIIPDPWQRDLLRSDSDRVLLNCCRQSGKSTMAAVIALHKGVYSPGSLTLILAPAERQAKETFGKVLTLFRGLGHAIPPDSYRKLGMELANGSRIEALPGSEKTIRGFSAVDLLILDEASRVDDALYASVRPMLATSQHGRLIALSTPYGMRGWWHQAWESREEEWERFEVPATEISRISDSFLQEERLALPRRIYRQEYLCSFEATEDQVFSLEDVDRAITDDVAPLFSVAEAS